MSAFIRSHMQKTTNFFIYLHFLSFQQPSKSKLTSRSLATNTHNTTQHNNNAQTNVSGYQVRRYFIRLQETHVFFWKIYALVPCPCQAGARFHEGQSLLGSVISEQGLISVVKSRFSYWAVSWFPPPPHGVCCWAWRPFKRYCNWRLSIGKRKLILLVGDPKFEGRVRGSQVGFGKPKVDRRELDSDLEVRFWRVRRL